MGIDPSGYGVIDDYNYQTKQKSNVMQSFREAEKKSVKPKSVGNAVSNFYTDYYTKKVNTPTIIHNTAEYYQYMYGKPQQDVYIMPGGEVIVRNPYPYGPLWVSQDVYNCMKDLEEGKELDLADVVDELDEMKEVIDAAADYYKTDTPLSQRPNQEEVDDMLADIKYSNLKYDMETILFARDHGGVFTTKEEALIDFADRAIPLTDVTNREHAAIMYGDYGIYYNSGLYQGEHNTVWQFAVSSGLYYAGPTANSHEEMYFMHTHPNYGWSSSNPSPSGRTNNNPFSGTPGTEQLWLAANVLLGEVGFLNGLLDSPEDFGDADVVDELGFDGIYLTSANGNVYLYEGVGTADVTHAQNEAELEGLPAIYPGLTKPSSWAYSSSAVDDPSKGSAWTP